MRDGLWWFFYDEEEENTEYQAFVDKFKPKKTTDDCYTPPIVYEAVKNWAVGMYGIDPEKILRPFYPGGDYRGAEYPAGFAVVDNPPFSILNQIIDFYVAKDIPFFLFSPTLTGFNVFAREERKKRCCYLPCGAHITYENGAVVNTSFVTNMDEYALRIDPDLYEAVARADDENRRQKRRELPKYQYPMELLTGAAAYQLAQHGQRLTIRREECRFVRKLDAQNGKEIFGGGLLISRRAAAERAAAERATAERAAATVWQLSEREQRIIQALEERRETP